MELTKIERYWFNEAIRLKNLVETYGCDLSEVRKLENKIYKGFISQYGQYPSGELRRYIVEMNMYSEKIRTQKVRAREQQFSQCSFD